MARKRNLQYVIGADVSRAKKGFRSLQGEVSCITASMRGLSSSLKKTLVGLGAFAGFQGIRSLAGSFVEAAKQAEGYQAKLRAIMGNAGEADATFRRIYDWAAKNPINTDEAVGAFVALKAAAVKNSEEAIRAIADISTVMQRDMRDVAQAIVSTEVEPLRNIGVLLDRTGKEAIIQSGEVRVAVGKDIDSIRQGILDVIRLNLSGAMQDYADTFDGVLKTMGGLWLKFKTDLMGSAGSGGPFDLIKKRINEISGRWERWMNSTDYAVFLKSVRVSAREALESLSGLGEGLLSVFRLAAENIDEVVSGLKALGTYKITGGLLGLLGVSGPAATAIAAAGGALVYLSDQLPIASDEASSLAEELGRLEGRAQALREEMSLRQSLEITVDDRELQEVESRVRALRAILPRIAEMHGAEAADALKQASRTMPIPNAARGKSLRADLPLAVPGEGKSGRSVAEKLVASMRDQMLYLGAEGKRFLPVLDAWAAKLKPLSEDWKAIADLQREIREAGSRQVGEEMAAAMERSRKAKEEIESSRAAVRQGVEQFWDEQAWDNRQGFLPDAQYLGMLQNNLAKLSAGTQEWRDRFAEVQSVAERLSSMTIDTLAGQFENGQITADQYRQALQHLLDKWREYPLVVQQVQSQMRALDDSIAGTTKNIQTLTAEAERALSEKLADVPADLSDAFASAVANSENLGDALRNLAKEIAYLTIKAMLLKSLGGLFGGLFGGGGVTGGILVDGGAFQGSPTGAVASSASFPLPGRGGLPRNSVGGIFTTSGSGGLSGSGGRSVVNVSINAVDAQSFVQLAERNRGVFEGIITNSILRNGAVRRAMQGAG